MIIPSIDLMDGKAVQLKQGQKKMLERSDIFELANEFRKYGEIAVIDLDAALGKGDNFEIIKKICNIADCRVGGGIRTIERAKRILQIGAKKIIIGTKATPDFLKQLPKEKIIVAIDTKKNYIVTQGWTKSTSLTPQQLIKELEQFCSGFLFTNVDKEGLMQGLDFEIVRELRSLTKNNLTVAGGITTIDDIIKLEKLGADSQIGMAIYTGKISLEKAFAKIIKLNDDQNIGDFG